MSFIWEEPVAWLEGAHCHNHEITICYIIYKKRFLGSLERAVLEFGPLNELMVPSWLNGYGKLVIKSWSVALTIIRNFILETMWSNSKRSGTTYLCLRCKEIGEKYLWWRELSFFSNIHSPGNGTRISFGNTYRVEMVIVKSFLALFWNIEINVKWFDLIWSSEHERDKFIYCI